MLAAMTMVFVLLLVVGVLAVRQYIVYLHCEQVVNKSSDLVFSFTSLKEHINAAMLSGKKINDAAVQREIQEHNRALQDIIDDILVPEELKLSFINQVDFIGLTVLLRETQDGYTHVQLQKISESLRSTSNLLQKFHAGISSHTNSLLLGLHRVMAGTMSMILVFLVVTLLLIQRYIVNPVYELCQQVQQGSIDDQDSFESSSRLALLSMDDIKKQVIHVNSFHGRIHNLSLSLNNFLKNMKPPFLSRKSDWDILCQTLQINPDYFLIWAGQFSNDESKNKKIKIIGCACETCSTTTCQEVIRHLFDFCHQDDGLCKSVKLALADKTASTSTVPMGSVPDMLRPYLSDDIFFIKSVSFPFADGEDTTIVLTIYSKNADCFDRIETTILQDIFQVMTAGNHIHHPENTFSMSNFSFSSLYQYAVIGAMADELANEITNTANGTLNYSQALLDMYQPVQGQEKLNQILVKLRNEEHKIAELAATIRQLGLDCEHSPPLQHLPDIVDEALKTLTKVYKRRHIVLTHDRKKDIPRVNVNKNEILTVLFSLVHHIIRVDSFAHSSKDKQFLIAIESRFDQSSNTIQVSLENCLPADNDPQEIISPWPTTKSCTIILQNNKADLVFKETPVPHCILIFPVSTDS